MSSSSIRCHSPTAFCQPNSMCREQQHGQHAHPRYCYHLSCSPSQNSDTTRRVVQEPSRWFPGMCARQLPYTQHTGSAIDCALHVLRAAAAAVADATATAAPAVPVKAVRTCTSLSFVCCLDCSGQPAKSLMHALSCNTTCSLHMPLPASEVVQISMV